VLPFPGRVLFDGDQGAEAEFTFGYLDALVLASLVLTARSAQFGTFCMLLDPSSGVVDHVMEDKRGMNLCATDMVAT